jgi:hypothetical protein
MKKIILILTCITLIAIVACSNNTADKNEENNGKENADLSASIVGTWIPIGLDFNVEGKTTPSGNWHYTNKQDSINIKNAGLSVEDGNLNFKANGTGFMGKEEPKDGDGAFKWKKLPGGKACYDNGEVTNTNAENIEIFYLDSKGQLIHHTSTKPLLMGKLTLQNSFELYKRK